ncbi:FAD-dependent oxidoreductase [Actinomadura bangladeshensis]|uniref:FAD-binding oxidoreductase n=1 Tax=Actinomadura bangladeshensis TaxID=453573 RepID=A0A6L9QIS1_9ACTN|nr:BBE domain-containing protein [Actinomadura bangladeshensis]NEA24988.1 FAD-binding oxidoreductase [Actinomadura bangladeshensis]
MSELSTLPSTVVRPGDRRYPALSRGFNQRWIAAPEYVRLVRTPEEARAALAEAVAEEPADPARARIAVRAGGHCYEDFVCGEDVRVILDVSPMCGVSYDSSMKAYCVEAGATNGHVYGRLYPVSGKVLPGGSCFSVGLGGHIPAGGFGLLSRQHGLTVDYLYAVEVAVVDGDKNVELVVARRDDEDSRLCELWWAHTGGGGGNFGVATRFWFRGLPQPPKQVLLTALAWDWEDVAEDDFAALVTAFGEYFRDQQNPSTAAGKLFAMLKLNHVSNGQIGLLAQVDVDDPDGERAMTDFIAALDGPIGPKATQMRSVMGEHFVHLDVPRVMPWLTATQMLDSGCQNRCGKYKSAYLRKPFTDRQIDAMWAYLGNEQYTDYTNRQALIQVDSYGSAINMPLHQTAVRQRDSILKVQYQSYWTKHDPAEDAHIAWIRDAYKATFAETGGVPVADGEITDGCYIGYPDGDLADPEWNGSGQSWETLYYKDAYAKLQEVKRHWDPCGVFRHAQSIRP